MAASPISGRKLKILMKYLDQLFVVMFGLCFSLMATQMIKDIMSIGVGTIIRNNLGDFIGRAMIIGLTFILSGIAFVHIYNFIDKFPGSGNLISKYIQVFLVIVLSAIPWTCYHIVRIGFHPFVNDLIVWKHIIFNVDVIFLCLYIPILGVLFILSRIT